jgi:hypothetical protein
MMNNLRSRYQIKKAGIEKWEDISEKAFMQKLVDRFCPLSPVLADILRGEEVTSPHETYRKINV